MMLYVLQEDAYVIGIFPSLDRAMRHAHCSCTTSAEIGIATPGQLNWSVNPGTDDGEYYDLALRFAFKDGSETTYLITQHKVAE